jgi:hypothetical protein
VRDPKECEASIRQFSAKRLCGDCQLKARRYRLTKVEIDGEMALDAYIVANERWNGWVMPYFTREQLPALLGYLKANGHPDARLDEARDAVITASSYEEDPEDVWGSEQIVVDGETLTTYPVGASCWIWDETLTEEEA